MKRFVSIVGAALFAAGAALVAQSVPELNYEANADVITLPAYGEVAGVATNSRGQVFVYARTGQPVATLGTERTFYHGGSRLFQFDQPANSCGRSVTEPTPSISLSRCESIHRTTSGPWMRDRTWRRSSIRKENY